MELRNYVDFLIDSNERVLSKSASNITDKGVLASFAFGFIEEIGEFNSSVGTTKASLEAGDVIAYTVLILASLGIERNLIAEVLKNTETKHVRFPNVYLFSGEIKRIFRGDSDVDYSLILSVLATALDFCLLHTDDTVTLLDLCGMNYDKLNARLLNQGDFNGRGER